MRCRTGKNRVNPTLNACFSRIRHLRPILLKSPIPVRCAYPLFLDLTDRVVVIIGGGPVAARKAAGVLAAGAKHVIVVAPKLTAEMPPNIEHLPQAYTPEHLTAADLAFAATDNPDINARIVRDARAAGILVNRADTDESDPGDFTVPATLRRGPITLAVSAGGAPLLAARIRDLLADALPPKWSNLAEIAQELRTQILEAIPDPTDRRKALQDMASDAAADQIALSGKAGLIAWLAAKHPSLTNPKSKIQNPK